MHLGYDTIKFFFMKHIHFHLDIRTQNLQSGFKSVERSIAVEVEVHYGDKEKTVFSYYHVLCQYNAFSYKKRQCNISTNYGKCFMWKGRLPTLTV